MRFKLRNSQLLDNNNKIISNINYMIFDNFLKCIYLLQFIFLSF